MCTTGEGFLIFDIFAAIVTLIHICINGFSMRANKHKFLLAVFSVTEHCLREGLRKIAGSLQQENTRDNKISQVAQLEDENEAVLQQPQQAAQGEGGGGHCFCSEIMWAKAWRMSKESDQEHPNRQYYPMWGIPTTLPAAQVNYK
jgi:hypothetical protein